jgi:hypothetical protein
VEKGGGGAEAELGRRVVSRGRPCVVVVVEGVIGGVRGPAVLCVGGDGDIQSFFFF